MWIYAIRNVITDYVYIGQTIDTNPKIRWYRHKCNLKKGNGINPKLQNAWNKYGEFAFKFEAIHNCIDLNELNNMEANLIKHYHSINKSYNITTGGDNCKYSIESRRKMSNSAKLRFSSEASRKKHSSDIKLGWTEEARSRQSNTIKTKHKLDPKYSTRIKENAVRQIKLFGKPAQAKTYNVKLLSPTGEIYGPITNLRQFSKKHNLHNGNILRVITGTAKRHRGWTLAK